MQNTTWSTISALESITSDVLNHVSGGCGGGKKHCSPCSQPVAAQVQQTQFLQLPAAPAAAPAPLPPSGPAVSTNVSINGQARA